MLKLWKALDESIEYAPSFKSKCFVVQFQTTKHFFQAYNTRINKETLRLSNCYHFQFFIIFAFVFNDNNRTNGKRS